MAPQIVRLRQRLKESLILYQSDSLSAVEAGMEAVRRHRMELEAYIRLHPAFLKALHPIDVEENAPKVVRLMAEAGEKAGVGPMAAVAGALADIAVEAMLEAGACVAIVEDGGEVSAVSKEPFTVGLYAGRSAIGSKLGFRVTPQDCPIGIGTSSSKTSHAISLGEADAATVFAYNAALADAAATAVCNAVMGKDEACSVREALELARRIPCIRGAFVVRGGYVGSMGWVPQLVCIELD